MRLPKSGVFSVLLCVCAVVIAALAASTTAAASHRAKTNLTIAVWPDGVFGYVRSPDAACETGRKVEVFRESQPGARAAMVKTESAGRNQVGYEWVAPTSRAHGNYDYAVADATAQCAAARSGPKLVSAQDLPRCPDTRDGKCTVVINYMIAPGCDSFGPGSGHCGRGYTDGTVWAGWGGKDTTFAWGPHSKKNERLVTYQSAGSNVQDLACYAKIEGDVPASNSPVFAVGYAQSSNRNFCYKRTFNTPNRAGVAPGQDGGPLYLNFDGAGFLRSTHIVIWGTLYMR
jgi:hypothetical protein